LVCAGAFSDPQAAIAEIPDIDPDVALVDEELQELSGISCIRLLRSKMPDLPIIVVAERASAFGVERALAAGASGYLVKSECQGLVIADAIRAVADGMVVLSPSARAALVECSVPPPGDGWNKLTPQERQIVRVLERGYSDNMIADEIGSSVNTVRWHLKSIYRRLGVSSRLEVVTALSKAQQKESTNSEG
jgi:two-component system nitrate/nitrite response regulator NarL